MIVWVDAQLSPGTARWLSSRFAIEAIPVRDLGLYESTDRQIFEAARTAGAVVMTKDRDFVELATIPQGRRRQDAPQRMAHQPAVPLAASAWAGVSRWSFPIRG